MAAGTGRRARVLAFYLPQFHPIAENDAWWGTGFTEWTNVVKARPTFPGHCQPLLPADLGFYDLRVPETRAAQAAAGPSPTGSRRSATGTTGSAAGACSSVRSTRSCVPANRRLPFCLAWANEPWSRRWLGEDRDVLMPQAYSAADDVAHARWLARVFADPRNLRIDGRPVFLVYRPEDLPEPHRTVDTIKLEADRLGVPEPFVIGISAHGESDQRARGFDATLDWEPKLGVAGDPRARA